MNQMNSKDYCLVSNIKPTVAVLMSTYNGDTYIREQLDSIIAQEGVLVKLVIRDDGSTDETKSILKEYQKKSDNIQLIEGNNIGCEESFKRLLYLPIEADYYAFADQDDVWYSNKLITAVKILSKFKYDLYVCNLMMADAQMHLSKPIFNSKEISQISDNFNKYIIGNLHGCVQVWTKFLHTIIQSYCPQQTFGHDVWVNSVANFVSSCFIDNNYYINYRLHKNNTSGKANNIFDKIERGFRLYIFGKHPTYRDMCRCLLEGFGQMTNLKEQKVKHIQMIANYQNNIRSKFRLIMSDMIRRKKYDRKILNIICILLNKF